MPDGNRNCVDAGGLHCLHWPPEGNYCCRCDHDTRYPPEAATSEEGRTKTNKYPE